MKTSTIEQAMKNVSDGKYNRAELLNLKMNAETYLSEKPEIFDLLELISNTAVPELELEYVFLGFCPGADLKRRRDTEWIKRGFIDFHFIESKSQMAKFEAIHPPDKIILKKRQKIGKTMIIHAFGEVTHSNLDKTSGLTNHSVNWKITDDPLEVPLLGCNSTVNIRSIEQVDENMPEEFWQWLKKAC